MSGINMPGIFLNSPCKSGRQTGFLALLKMHSNREIRVTKNIRQEVTPDGTEIMLKSTRILSILKNSSDAFPTLFFSVISIRPKMKTSGSNS